MFDLALCSPFLCALRVNSPVPILAVLATRTTRSMFSVFILLRTHSITESRCPAFSYFYTLLQKVGRGGLARHSPAALSHPEICREGTTRHCICNPLGMNVCKLQFCYPLQNECLRHYPGGGGSPARRSSKTLTQEGSKTLREVEGPLGHRSAAAARSAPSASRLRCRESRFFGTRHSPLFSPTCAILRARQSPARACGPQTDGAP